MQVCNSHERVYGARWLQKECLRLHSLIPQLVYAWLWRA